MAIDTASLLATINLLDGSTTVMADQDTAVSLSGVGEVFGGFPLKIAAGVTTWIALGTLTSPRALKVSGAEGVKVLFSRGGDEISADPWYFIADQVNGLGISEVGIKNEDTVEHDVTILAVE